jgi:hypothetical protein
LAAQLPPPPTPSLLPYNYILDWPYAFVYRSIYTTKQKATMMEPGATGRPAVNFAHGDVATYFLIMATPPGEFNTHARGPSIYKNCPSSSANGKKSSQKKKLIGKKYARKTGSYSVAAAAAALLPTFQSNNNNNFFSLPLKSLFFCQLIASAL